MTEIVKLTDSQIALIKNTVAKNATDDELKLFLYRCNNMGLDPLKPGQIYFVKYGGGPGTIVVGIEGFRSRAARTKQLAGIKRGTLKDDKGKLIGAWCEVFRHDWKECAREEVAFVEYNTNKAMWAKMPETMIKKVAECAALRMAFPDELGGIYEPSEMDQASRSGVSIQDDADEIKLMKLYLEEEAGHLDMLDEPKAVAAINRATTMEELEKIKEKIAGRSSAYAKLEE